MDSRRLYQRQNNYSMNFLFLYHLLFGVSFWKRKVRKYLRSFLVLVIASTSYALKFP